MVYFISWLWHFYDENNLDDKETSYADVVTFCVVVCNYVGCHFRLQLNHVHHTAMSFRSTTMSTTDASWLAHRAKQTCMAWSWKSIMIYAHCLTHIFQPMRPLCMKSLGECAQHSYGAPRWRIRSNWVQVWELCNLQIRWYPVLANLGRTDRPTHILILTTMDQNDQNEPGQYSKGLLNQSTLNSATLTHLLFFSQISHFLDVWIPQIIISFFDHI